MRHRHCAEAHTVVPRFRVPKRPAPRLLETAETTPIERLRHPNTDLPLAVGSPQGSTSRTAAPELPRVLQIKVRTSLYEIGGLPVGP